jgi:hypothetical protein
MGLSYSLGRKKEVNKVNKHILIIYVTDTNIKMYDRGPA